MQEKINPDVFQIQISGIRQFFNKVAQIPDAVQLTIGQPDFPTPEHVKQAGQDAIEHNQTTYTPNAGIPELRRAASSFVKEKYGLSYHPEQEVITTIGASQALDITLRTTLEPGSEVILPGPVYPAYEPLIRLCQAKPVYIDTRDTGFVLNPDRLQEALTERTRCVILPYPSNPTGCVLSADEMHGVADVLRKRDVFIVSDEIYSELVYADRHISIAAMPGMRDKTIVINGLSKSHAMTGWRIGFAFAPEYVARHMLKVHQYNVSCASSVSQYAALQALTEGREDAAPMRAEYEKRRDYVYARLTEMGLSVEKPHGAFYMFPSVARFGLSSSDFASQLLEQEKLAVVPGDAFSVYGEGFVRISYAYAADVLQEGCDRLERFVRSIG